MKVIHRGWVAVLVICHHDNITKRMLRCPDCGVRRGDRTFNMPPVKLYLTYKEVDGEQDKP